VFLLDVRLRTFASRPTRRAYYVQVGSMSPEARIKALRDAPPDGWVAFSSDEERLVAYGKTYDEVVTKAEKNGEPDPVLTKVPKDWSMQVLLS
jgi:Family of unknown function (DUF5678)